MGISGAFPNMTRLLLSLAALLAGLAGSLAITNENAALGLSLTLPENWTSQPIHGRSDTLVFLVPPAHQQDRNSLRKIHLVLLPEKYATLEDALNHGIDRATERSPKWGSSNDRKHFLGATPITTASGIQDLRADFGEPDQYGSIRHTIIKYYFRHRNGSTFKVCSHVFGDDILAAQYEKAILAGLAYLPAK